MKLLKEESNCVLLSSSSTIPFHVIPAFEPESRGESGEVDSELSSERHFLFDG
jgi:hypothetical protein